MFGTCYPRTPTQAHRQLGAEWGGVPGMATRPPSEGRRPADEHSSAAAVEESWLHCVFKLLFKFKYF